MNALIVYDSVHGNTEKVARAMGGAIAALFVNGTRGPLREGELERAVGWAKGITV